MTLRTAFLAVFAVALAAPALAQPMKVGYVDTDQIVIRMPAFAEVQTQLQQQQAAVGARVRVLQDSLQTVFQAELADYQEYANSPLATDAARAEREQELLALRNDIEQAEVQGLQYLSYAEARLLQPVLNSIDEAIQAEAVAGSYDLVLPTVANNAPVFLYRSERVDDLTEGVMTRLGIDPASAPIGSAPAAAAPTAPVGQ